MSKGAGCDCEIFLNDWSLQRTYQVWDPETEEYDYPEELPACKGVRAGSIQPCDLLGCPPLRALGIGRTCVAQDAKLLLLCPVKGFRR
jgi:hypothetical protein